MPLHIVSNLHSSSAHEAKSRLRITVCCSGRKKEVIDKERSEMYKAQQEILNARRSGKSMEGVTERRAKAKQAVCALIFCAAQTHLSSS